MIFRRCSIAGIDYNHPPPENVKVSVLKPESVDSEVSYVLITCKN
jgi:hypothetical protein